MGKMVTANGNQNCKGKWDVYCQSKFDLKNYDTKC